MSARLKIVHLYPELLNLYGDRGNVAALEKRCTWRGIEVVVERVLYGERPGFADADIVYLGGGTDRDQRIAGVQLQPAAGDLRSYVEDGGVLLAVCGGYELLGCGCRTDEGELAGLGLVDLRVEQAPRRLVGNALVQCDLCAEPLVGYENHAGRVCLGDGVQPLGRVLHGHGNDGASGYEGCVHRNVVGTYLHGPLLPKNPGLADWLLARALERKTGTAADLAPLDDAVELAANRVMAQRVREGEE